MSTKPTRAPSAPSADGRSATAGSMQCAIRATSPERLLNLVPYLLGFHPQDSVVVIGTKGSRGRVEVTQRFPLHQPVVPRLTEFNAEQAVRVLTSQECSKAFVVGYGPETLVTPFFGQFCDAVVEYGIAVPEVLRTVDQRYWSYVCTDPRCCPPEGTPYELTADPELAALLAEGVPDVFGSRDGLAAMIAPVTGAEATAMRRATERAEARVRRLLEQAPASNDAPSGHALMVAEGITAVQVTMQRFQQGGDITPAEAAWLTVVMRDVRVRDDFWSRLEPDGRKENLRLLVDLTRLACPRYVATPASLLAFTAWQCGNGALANVALDRALAGDRDYTLAHTLRWAINLGLHPRLARVPLTPEQVAEAYASQDGQP